MLKNGVVIGAGERDKVAGGSSGFNHAALRSVAMTLSSPAVLLPGDVLSLRLSARASPPRPAT